MSDRPNHPETPTNAPVVELLSFLVGGQDFAVEIMSVREIRGGARATSLPHAPGYVRGVINLRGTVLPIMDLSRRLGMAAATDEERNVIIVVAIGERTVGLMVDAVSDILSVPQNALQPPPEIKAESERNFVSALTIVDERMFRVLDLNALVPPQGEEVA